jgi:hypothetical protein
MKKLAILGATALASTLAFASPAAAQSAAGLASMQTACNNALPTNGNAQNQITYAARVTDIVPSTLAPTIVTGALTQLTPPATTPTSTTPPTFIPGTEARRGGSPNIHGEFVATATYAGGTFSQDITTTPRTSYSFNCTIDKTTGGTRVKFESGWKVEAASEPLIESGTPVVSTRTINGDPVIEPFYSDGVICNSPGRRGGIWTSQNGYGGNCATLAASGTISFANVRSNSLPNHAPVFGDPEGSTGESGDRVPFVNAVIDTDPVIDEATGE